MPPGNRPVRRSCRVVPGRGLAFAPFAAVCLCVWWIGRPAWLAPARIPGVRESDAVRILTWGDQGDGTYRNPILKADYSDPDMIRVGDDFFLVASDFHFVGMQILHSRDLVNWQIIGQVFGAGRGWLASDRPSPDERRIRGTEAFLAMAMESQSDV